MNQKDIVKKASTVVISKSTISTAGLVTLLLVVLKITDNIDIGWLWVFAPYWLPFALVLGFIILFMLGAFIIAGIILAVEAWDSRKNGW